MSFHHVTAEAASEYVVFEVDYHWSVIRGHDQELDCSNPDVDAWHQHSTNGLQNLKEKTARS